jgi:hypothetical protein
LYYLLKIDINLDFLKLLAQHRSIRDSFTSRVKDTIYAVFGNELPYTDTHAIYLEIQEWKTKSSVRKCHAKLFKKIREDQPTTYMSKIIEKLWKTKKDAPKVQIAYAISICETYLDPENQIIQMNENVMKPKIIKNMVSLT